MPQATNGFYISVFKECNKGRKERSKGGEEGGKKARRLVVTRGHGELLFNGYRVLQDEKSSEDRQ